MCRDGKIMNEILLHSLRIFRNNARYIVLITIPYVIFMLPSYFLLEPLRETSQSWTVFGLVVYLFTFAAFNSTLVFFLGQEYQQKLQPVRANIINGIVYAPLVMVAMIIAYLPLVVVAVLIFQNKALLPAAPFLVIAGLYIYFRTLFSPFHLILEGCNPIAAVVRSFSSTRGQVAKIFLIVLIYVFAVLVIESGFVMRSTEGMGNSILFLCGVIFSMLMVSLQQIAFFLLYLQSFDKDGQGIR